MAEQSHPGSITAALLPEFDIEMATTRKHLERVPDDKFPWRPHDKSMTLGELASHIAEGVSWTPGMLQQDSLDFGSPEMQGYKPPLYESHEALLEAFDANVSEAREAISSMSDAQWMEMWEMRNGDQVMLSMPKAGVARAFLMSHNVHHRGQLSVFLRLCDVPVPQTYGPSADESDM